MSKSIYDLGLHETIEIPPGDIIVARVPGGWVYSIIRYHHEVNGISSTFIPFSDEYCPENMDRCYVCGLPYSISKSMEGKGDE